MTKRRLFCDALGQNLIHDGHSLLETAAWLQAHLREVVQ
jgi:hypothetical protein